LIVSLIDKVEADNSNESKRLDR